MVVWSKKAHAKLPAIKQIGERLTSRLRQENKIKDPTTHMHLIWPGLEPGTFSAPLG